MGARKGREIVSCYAHRLVEALRARARSTVQCGFDAIAWNRSTQTRKKSIPSGKESIKTCASKSIVIRSKHAKNPQKRPFLTDWSKCFAEDFAIGKKSSCQFGNGTWRRKRWSLTSKEDS